MDLLRKYRTRINIGPLANRLLGTLLLGLLFTTKAFSQQKTANYDLSGQVQDQLILKTNPFGLLSGPIFPFCSEARGTIEVVHGIKQSSQLSASYLFKPLLIGLFEDPNGVTGTIDDLIFEGYRIQGSHRWFLFSSQESLIRAPSGFYVGPHVSYSSLKIADKYYNQFQSYFRATYFNVNFLFGYQMNIGDVYFDLNLGFGYKNNFWIEQLATLKRVVPPDELGFGDYFRSPMRIHFGFETGWAF